VNTADVERLIEEGVRDARAEVRTPRNPDDDAHFAAVVVSPAFEGESLVERHQRVHDALGEHVTDSTVVAIGMLAGVYMFIARFLDALNVGVEDAFTAEIPLP